MRSDDPQEPTWAAQRAWDTVDHFVLMEEAERGEDRGEAEILGHAVVQRELQRQLDDLGGLEALAPSGGIGAGDVTRIREAARQQALSVFSAS